MEQNYIKSGKIISCRNTCHCGVRGEVIIEQQIIPVNPDAHIINSNGIKKPTCAETGSYGVSMCIECGEVFDTGKTLPALGHDFSNWETNLEYLPQGYAVGQNPSQIFERRRVCGRL